MNIFLRLYDCFSRRRPLLWLLLAGVVAVLLILCSRLHFSEDISDFLPLTQQQKESMTLYQEITQADRIMILFDAGQASPDIPETLLDAVDAFEEAYSEAGIAHPLTAHVDMQPYMDAIRFVYANIPYFLQDQDYRHMDSLLALPGYIPMQMENNRRALNMPLSSFVSTRIQYDPLDLFTPAVNRLQQFRPGTSAFEMTDGYMLTKDHRMAFAYLDSPYGASETQNNAMLIDSLQQLIQTVPSDIAVRLLGAPVIAVGNARQIKHDSVLTIAVALLLIAVLLAVFSKRAANGRKVSLRTLFPILCTIAFGMLFGTAILAAVHPDISLIVLGISAVLIGIAVNYPLHLVVHRQYTPDMRTNLKEELSPLIIGNITTIAAFLTLLPLQATALRDLGIFAAAMLVGTIIFSVIFLPHFPSLAGASGPCQSEDTVSVGTPLRKHTGWLYILLLLITIACAVFAPRLEFDSNLSNINYMTSEQREDFAYLTALTGGTSDTRTVYRIYHDTAWDRVPLSEPAMQFLPSPVIQAERLQRWNTFCEEHRDLLATVRPTAQAYGFHPSAFDRSPIAQDHPFAVHDSVAFFHPLTSTVLQAYYHNRCFIQPVLLHLGEPLPEEDPIDNTSRLIDIQSTNRQVTAALSDNFNYIGTACSIIVFFFLWLSFIAHFRGQPFLLRTAKALWLACIAFIPMLVSWIWILGAMHLFGLQFNIVNIILATFIFGQGDDYTIFIVEGLLYEHRTGKRLLPQFRREIILSALIMLVGIGVLTIAKHPAMFSIGAVTLIGMASVVIMSLSLPPLLFRLSLSLRNRRRSRGGR